MNIIIYRNLCYYNMKNFFLYFILLLSIASTNAQTNKEIKTVANCFKDMVLVPVPVPPINHERNMSGSEIKLTDSDTNYITHINPYHLEKIKRTFYISTHEVTNAEYKLFISWVQDSLKRINLPTIPLLYCYNTSGKIEKISITPDSIQWITNLSNYSPLREKWMENYHNLLEFNSYPIVNISWQQAQAYVHWLNNRTKEVLIQNHLSANWGKFRLPESDEWEYSAMVQYRNGWWLDENQACYYTYAWEGEKLTENNNYKANFGAIIDQNSIIIKKANDDGYSLTAPIKSYKPNLLGLYDISGNVSEWTNTQITLDSIKLNYKKLYQYMLEDKYAYLLTEILKENPDWKVFEQAIDTTRNRYQISREPDILFLLPYIKEIKQKENYNIQLLSKITDGVIIKGGSWENPPCYMINTSFQVLSKNYSTPQTGFRIALTFNPELEKLLGKYLNGYSNFILSQNK
jgi:formylglycine-generating enzyme required for sulfatase activity